MQILHPSDLQHSGHTLLFSAILLMKSTFVTSCLFLHGDKTLLKRCLLLKKTICYMVANSFGFNPIALRKAKIVYSFDLSKCKDVSNYEERQSWFP